MVAAGEGEEAITKKFMRSVSYTWARSSQQEWHYRPKELPRLSPDFHPGDCVTMGGWCDGKACRLPLVFQAVL